MIEQRSQPEWWFYHLQRSSLEQAIGPLLTKCLSRDWRVLVLSGDADRRDAVDQALWTYEDDSFLPHGQAEAAGLDAAEQPVLIAAKADNQNRADVALLLDGFELPANAAFSRCMVMFDDGDNSARQMVRQQYKKAKENSLVARYFQQSESGWSESG